MNEEIIPDDRVNKIMKNIFLPSETTNNGYSNKLNYDAQKAIERVNIKLSEIIEKSPEEFMVNY